MNWSLLTCVDLRDEKYFKRMEEEKQKHEKILGEEKQNENCKI